MHTLVGKIMNKIKSEIVKLWEAGYSSNKIAIQLGITRGSVMGNIYRLREKGINLRSKVVLERNLQPAKEPDMPSREKNRKKPISPKQLNLLYLLDPVPEPPASDPVPELPASDPEHSVKLVDLEYWHCRYIVSDINYGDTLYCGKPTTYKWCCADHHKLCYVPNVKKVKQTELTTP